MPSLSKAEATEKIVAAIERADPGDLGEIYSELFPERPSAPVPASDEIVRHIRHGLEAEEVVDLWNVVFPEDRHVWYDEEEKVIHYNEGLFRFAE